MSKQSASVLKANVQAAVKQLESLCDLEAALMQAAGLVSRCLTGGHKLLTCGNGGSAADAAHVATEFVCRYRDDREPYPAICLNDAGSTLTAIANDYAAQQVFARQVRAFGQAGDMLMVFSTSGRSSNVRSALLAGRDVGVESIAFLGRDGGDSKGIATVDLLVSGDVTVRIQEAHQLLYHTLCEMVEPDLAPRTPGSPRK